MNSIHDTNMSIIQAILDSGNNPLSDISEKLPYIQGKLRRLSRHLKDVEKEWLKHCHYPEYPKHLTEKEMRLHRYATLKLNMERIWDKSKDEDLLYALLYVEKLQCFNIEVYRFLRDGVIHHRLSALMLYFHEDIDRLLQKYHALHTKRKEDDDITELLRDLGEV